MGKFPFGEKKIEQLKNMPLIRHKVFKTKDGKYVVNQTQISSVKPVNYYAKVIETLPEEEFSW